jgi:hypothetical protein
VEQEEQKAISGASLLLATAALLLTFMAVIAGVHSEWFDAILRGVLALPCWYYAAALFEIAHGTKPPPALRRRKK